MFVKSVFRRLKALFRSGTVKWLSKEEKEKKKKKRNGHPPLSRNANSKMADKYAKVCPLKLNFAKFLCNYTEGLREARLTEGSSAQRLGEVLAREDEGVRGDGVCWCSERRVKKQALQISLKGNRKT